MSATFEIKEWYQLRRGEAWVGVDLADDMPSLDPLWGKTITVKLGERSKIVKVVQTEPPHHMPPYLRGERIGLMVEFEQGE